MAKVDPERELKLNFSAMVCIETFAFVCVRNIPERELKFNCFANARKLIILHLCDRNNLKRELKVLPLIRYIETGPLGMR